MTKNKYLIDKQAVIDSHVKNQHRFMEVIKKILTDALVLKPSIFNDERGCFFESFNKNIFSKIVGKDVDFVQDNQSCSSRGTLRGLHYQRGNAAQAKLVRVIRGSVYDVAVDLRPHSKTFGQSYGTTLSDQNHLQFYIPRGFAHGFLALEDDTVFQYKVDNFYSSDHEAGFIWNDRELKIDWPNLDKVMSEKDKMLPNFNQNHPL